LPCCVRTSAVYASAKLLVEQGSGLEARVEDYACLWALPDSATLMCPVYGDALPPAGATFPLAAALTAVAGHLRVGEWLHTILIRVVTGDSAEEGTCCARGPVGRTQVDRVGGGGTTGDNRPEMSAAKGSNWCHLVCIAPGNVVVWLD
jgi:hypothetical protein